jgi:hypothetical protein
MARARRLALLTATGLMALPAAAAANQETMRYLITIRSKPALTVSGTDQSGDQYQGTAQATWTGHWFAKFFVDRQQKTVGSYSVATPASTASKTKSTFIGAAGGSFHRQSSSTSSSDCSWDTDAQTALLDIGLHGEGLDGLRGGARRSYKKSGMFALWLTAREGRTTSFGTCQSGSGSATPEWLKPKNVFLNADQCIFGQPDNSDGTADTEGTRATVMRLSAKKLGAKSIPIPSGGFDARADQANPSCSPFSERFALGQQTSNPTGGMLTGRYEMKMTRLDKPKRKR